MLYTVFTTVFTDALRRLNYIGVTKQAEKKEEEKTRKDEDTGTKKRRRGGSAPLGVITNDNNVITQTLSKNKNKKDNRKHGRFNTNSFKLTALG